MAGRSQYGQGNMSQAVGHRFEVNVGKVNLGSWSKLSGLDVKFDLAEHRIGSSDQYFKYAAIPKFSKLKLARAADREATPVVRAWLNTVHRTGGVGESGSVRALSSAGTPVMEWDLQEMFPHEWSISDFDATAGKVVVETLVIVYSGFLEPVASGGGGRGTVT